MRGIRAEAVATLQILAVWRLSCAEEYKALLTGLRIGLSPLCTSFVETYEGVAAIRDVLRGILLGQSGLTAGV